MRTMHPLSDPDVEVFQRLVRYKVQRFFGGRLNHHDYEDYCSQTMVLVLEKLSAYDSDRGSLFNYIAQAAHSSILDLYRRGKAAKRIAAPGTQTLSLNTPYTISEDSVAELWQLLGNGHADADSKVHLKLDLADGLDKLTARERSLLELKRSGNSAAQIARELGVNRGTVYRRLAALKVKLRPLEIYL